ncbi:alpha/beta fold hydrolase [Acinetobacter soli]|uniref:alpha/beta fold hydrolase n=1 Tax=Acinetobacter soli TaxID=487316 RepID=UPI00125032C2|nr:alpha/beta hydrolase [Acinetobacter soli]
MTTYVLVHGSWHDGSLWEPVATRLRAQGHTVHCPTVAGHGPNADRNVTHAQCSQSIADYIVKHNLSEIVLLGHSYGGTIISKVAEAIPERIQRLIYWNAFVLQDGENMFDNMPEAYYELFTSLAAASGDNTVLLPYEVWRHAFINDADDQMAEETYKMLTPEPCQPFHDRLDLKKFNTLNIPKSYLNCTEDQALPAGFWHPKMSSRLGEFKLVEMGGSHEAMFTRPQELATKIIEASHD